MGITSNAKQVASAWERMAASVEPELRAATLEATRATWAISKREMAAGIYNKPVPKRTNGKPAWRRTGNLRRSERYRLLTAYVGIINNDASYAKARHDMKNTRFPAPWREAAIGKSEGARKRIYTRHIKKLIAAGRLRGVR